MVGLQTAITPPHAPPTKEEKAKSTKLEFLLKQRSGPLLVKGFCWGAALAEAGVLVAQYSPSLPGSEFLLSTLILPGGAAEQIIPSPQFFFGAFMTAFGGLIRYKCYKALGSLFTFEMSIRRDHVLVITGPYSVVRHPAYAGILLAFGGLLLMHGSEGSWVRESGVLETVAMRVMVVLTIVLGGTIITGLLSRMSKEDEALHQFAGKEWEDWARRVPYKLIPWIY
ncbi:Protein-S-isoprenylcysteine O-methyltransferase B [Leucoagaricus sp. SymC.cos]|nr:Protein-S-isoprenylcysteine O-methyltransferase B [Leucoagaricus sp. SymC.cos]